jgi:hypothetical protein
VLRLARVPGGGVGDAFAVWAATRQLADELIAAGASPERTAWLPPAVSAPVGDGGAGVLAVLPMHEPALADRMLDALAAVDGAPVRLLPTVGGPATAARVSRLPGAELLTPVSTEREFSALAGSSDAVLAIDPSDPYGRRALIAAAAGAAPEAAGGTAAGEVLGALLRADDGADVATLAASIERAITDTAARAARAGAVAATCAPDLVAARLHCLVTELLSAAARPPFDLRLLAC